MAQFSVAVALANREMPVSGVGTHTTLLLNVLRRHGLLSQFHLSSFRLPLRPTRAAIKLTNRLLGINHEEYWLDRELTHFRDTFEFRPATVIHCQGEFALWALGPTAKRMGLPIVSTVHGLDSLHVCEHRHGKKADRTSRERYQAEDRIERQALLKADHVIAVDSNHRRLIIERGYPASRITVIYNSVDMDEVDRWRGAGAALNLPGPYIFASRRLDPKNGIDILLNAVSMMRNHPNVLIAGTGSRERELKAQSRRLGLTNRVLFLGALARESVIGLTWNADLCVVPSVPRGGTFEATSLSAIEAMAAGKLVIASNIGGLSEIISHGHTGVLVAPGDASALAQAIDAALENPAYRPTIGAAARRYVQQNLSLDHWFRKHMAVYIQAYQDSLRSEQGAVAWQALQSPSLQ